MRAMKLQFPDLHLSVNGGIETLDQARAFLDAGLDGVMIGRAAYHNPSAILLAADPVIFGTGTARVAQEVVYDMLPYIDAHLASGGRLQQITRHMMGLFTGRPGARQWRRILSENAHADGAGNDVVLRALDAVMQAGSAT